MSAFCVFGITLAQCRAAAEKKVYPYIKDESYVKGKRPMTQEEFTDAVNILAMQMFEGGDIRQKQISPAFDAPQFAVEWIDIGRRSDFIRDTKIIVRGIKNDKHGNPILNKKTGAEVITWMPYDGKISA